MRCLFVVQGEGRGHMTQAIAMSQMLADAGHEVCATLVGTSPRREIPAFFLDKIGIEVYRFESPNFIADARHRGILVGRTMWTSLWNAPHYLRSFNIFHKALATYQPDLVINFYEPLWGLYQGLRGSRCPTVCVAHQCLSLHPDFPFPDRSFRDKFLLKLLTKVATLRASAVLALSFSPLDVMRRGRLHVVPPLLRTEVLKQEGSAGGHLLVYLMSHGYAEDIMRWHEANPEVKIECFWDRKGVPEVDVRDETLTFHTISDTKFLSKMVTCRGLVTTAGFESVCEAMYFGKPILMVPVEHHFEQMCNAKDAERVGAGMVSTYFDLDGFRDYLTDHTTDPDEFRSWAHSASDRILPLLEQASA